MVGPSEAGFESAICESLISGGGYVGPVKVGNAQGDPRDFDAVRALDTAELFTFIGATQAGEWEKVRRSHGSADEAQAAFADRLASELDKRGTVDVLRRGVVYAGHEKAEFRLAFFRPSSGLNPESEALYRANRLTVTRQLPFDPGSSKTLDVGLFVNGIPVATAELKTHLTGQTSVDARAQYRGRDHRNRLLRRAVVHFAVDTEQVFMTTGLAGEKTQFLPFNRGDGERAGNPARGDGYRTGYLWEEVWSKDAWLDLLARFVHTDEDTVIFPRFHQWDAVRRLEAAAREEGPGRSYLVQHSAGSGKSNTIAWLAHRLSSLHDRDDAKVFDKVVVITDRVVLDRQLQETIFQFEHTHGVVEKIDTDSAQLASALTGEKARIIITTLQKFPFVMRHVEELKARAYAVIIDEAHSSQTGDSAKEMKKVLGVGSADPVAVLKAAEAAEWSGVEELPDPVEDALVKEVEARGRQSNMSFFAFTATPKARTLELFGQRSADGMFEPFHLYSMRQAIEERFILDVLANYVTYDTYFKIDKAIEEDPNLDSARGRVAIARFVSLHEYNLVQRAEVIVNHFRTHVATKIGGDAKAMVVTASRLHALRYKQALDKYCQDHGIGGVNVLAAFSGDLEVDGETLTEAKVNGFPDTETPKRFDTDEWQILVVAEKYQTGFDQPKLYAMYVDKTLSGLAAVQTLSRLNRTYRDKNGTFVLDFRNSVEDIQTAFEPWFARTIAPKTDPHLLYDTHAELAPFGVLVADEVEAMVGLLLDDPDKNGQRINGLLVPAVDRFWALDEDRQNEFRDALGRFTRIYSFLSQVVSFTDIKLERDYLYCRALLRLIPTEIGGGVDLGDAVELTHLALDCTFEGDGSLDAGDGELPPAIATDGGRPRDPDEIPLSEIIAKINERFGANITETDRLFTDQIRDDLVADPQVQVEAGANDEQSFGVGFDKTWVTALTGRLGTNEKFAFELLDNEDLRAAVVEEYKPDIYRRARVARQRTCPIGELIGADREDRHLEYKSTMRWAVRQQEKARYVEDAIVKTVAGFLNSAYGGTLLVGVTDDGDIHGLEDDYATFSKRGERGDRDLWGQHLKNLLSRLGASASTLVDWEYHTINGDDVCRVSVDPADHPVYETKGDDTKFWWRSPIGTDAIEDETERDRIIARRWRA
ncbi:putative DNA binding domain-containing protein [Acidimicrobiales bacterium]|nr:putative DNA binding domain-containing protein [Acidimicrobiales bacterium]